MKALNWVILVMLLSSSVACKQSKTKQGLVDKASELESAGMFLDAAGFQKTINGKETGLYKLSNASGMEVYVTNFGAVIVAILAPDRLTMTQSGQCHRRYCSDSGPGSCAPSASHSRTRASCSAMSVLISLTMA